MFCRNCGKNINEQARYCPYCKNKVNLNEMGRNLEIDKYQNSNKLILTLSVLSLVSVFIAIHEVIMIGGIIMGLISLSYAIYSFLKKKPLKKSDLIITFAIAGILANISWLIYTLYIL